MIKDLRFRQRFTPLEDAGHKVGRRKKLFLNRWRFDGIDRSLKGFTLIEILVVLGILSVLATFGYLVTIDFYKSYAFDCERNTIVSILQKARSRSLANINESAHGVHFDPEEYVLFQGAVYYSGAPSNQVFPAAVGIAHSGIINVVFDQLSGDVSLGGSLILNDGKRSAAISINSEGQINW